jgi:hypothetical protein
MPSRSKAPRRVGSLVGSVALSALSALACSSETKSGSTPDAGHPELPVDPRFDKVTVHREFQCEGATFGDFDGDGVGDVVMGPDLYLGPDFVEQRSVWARPQVDPNVRGYSDCFFEWAHDFDGDDLLDVLMIAFPGQFAAWYKNPGTADGLWERNLAVPSVDGESPEWVDLTGDDQPELVYFTGGVLGYAGPDPAAPTAPWTFHPISDARGYGGFTHGLGVGDLDGDGRKDVLEATGYFLQPPSLDGDPLWTRVDQAFGSGGAQMEVRDLDHDGDADVVATLMAHGYGLAWYEQGVPGTTPAFTEHVLVPNVAPGPEASVILHEPHALRMADMDGDGTDDIVTGERHWAHIPAEGTPFETPGHLYWFRVGEDGGAPTFEPRLVDDDSGVGTQVTVGDVNGDDRMDIVVANKKGAFVFLQK